MLKLNLACGERYMGGYINLDNNKNIKADIYHDINTFPWPFKDNEFDEIFCHHILEHVEDLLKTMEEIWRISKNKSRIFPIFTNFYRAFRIFLNIRYYNITNYN